MIIYKPIFNIEKAQIGMIALELQVEDFLEKLIDSSLLAPDTDLAHQFEVIYEVINPQTKSVIYTKGDTEGKVEILPDGGFLTLEQRNFTRLTKNYFNVTL